MKAFAGLLFLLMWAVAAISSLALPAVLVWAIVHFVFKYW